MSNYEVISFDPGETTGYAIFILSGKIAQVYEAGAFNKWARLNELISRPTVMAVIAEDFYFSKATNPIAARILGVIEYLACLHSKILILKRPLRASLLPDEFKRRGQSIHANSAILHGLVHLAGNKLKVLPQEVESDPEG